MNNPLFGGMPQMQGPMGGIQQMFQKFMQFKQQFQGDPQQQIQQMLNSGKINQSQYNAAYQQAQQIMQMMGKK